MAKSKSKTTKTTKAAKTTKAVVPRPAGASEIPPIPKGPVGDILNDERTSPLMKHTHPSATRQEIRALDRRVMGSRQSKKPVERTNQRRQPKTGGSGGHGDAGRADRTAKTPGKKK